MSDASDPVAITKVLRLEGRPEARRQLFENLWSYRSILGILARQDFQTRYKRATLGLAWSVVVPVLQASVMAFIFSRVVKIRSGGESGFAVYVMSGVIAYSYFATVLPAATTSIVDNRSLTDKVWFPRAILVLVPCISNLVGFAASVVVLIVVTPFLGGVLGLQTILLLPAVLLLLLLCSGFGLILGALNVYFRDVRFLVQASLLVWMYVTPILYPPTLLHRFGLLLNLNPLTGVVTLFHMATVGSQGPWLAPVAIAVIITFALIIVGLEAQRRHDRLFVDLL